MGTTPADKWSFFVLAPACGVMCICLPSGAWCRSPRGAAPVNVRTLVRNMVYNQLQGMRRPAHRYQYTHREITPHSSQTTVEIQTQQGMVARLTQVDGHPPTQKECRKNRVRLARIASSPRLARQRLKSQQTDLERREELFEAMPQAVLFRYDGTEPGTGWIRLKYRPNPAFRPRRRVGGVLQGLAGTLWVDPSSQHLVRIDGKLVRTVSFGWGVLAKLYPGGHFIMQQKRLPDGAWQLTSLDVSFQGVILLFKRLNVNLKELYGAFEETPENLTLAQAVERLDRIPVACGKP